MKIDILPEKEKQEIRIMPQKTPDKKIGILPQSEKEAAITPSEPRSWNGMAQTPKWMKPVAALAALIVLAMCGWTTLSPARLAHDLEKTFWFQEAEEGGYLLVMEFNDGVANLYSYSLFGTQQIGYAPYEVTSFRTVNLNDTKLTIDVRKDEFKVSPALTTDAESEVWVAGW